MNKSDASAVPILPQTVYGPCLTDPRLDDKRVSYPFKRRDRFYQLSARGIFETISSGQKYKQGRYKRQRDNIEGALAKLGLPMPHKDIIHRGREHDLLFMPDYGLVIRVGNIDIPNLIHPRNLQPLICMRGMHRRSDVSIYPGIRLFVPEVDGGQDRIDELDEYFIQTAQGNFDITDYNSGFVDIGDTGSFLVNLDIDDDRCGTMDEKLARQKSAHYARLREAGAPQYIAIREALSSAYGHLGDTTFMDAYDTHQDLRIQIQEALLAVDPIEKLERLGAFYQICANSVSGMNADVALYAPWSGQSVVNQRKPSKLNGPA